MTTLSVIKPEPAAWDAFVAAHPQGHILQTPAWAALKSQFGWSSASVALGSSPDDLVAGAQILLRNLSPWTGLPFRAGTMAYIPKGPLAPADWWSDSGQMQPLWDAIHKTARGHAARWLKVEAPDPVVHSQEAVVAMEQTLHAGGFHPSPQNIQPPRTVLIDLRPDVEDILKRMKQKTRYNIRLSAKKDVTIRQGTSADVASFNALMAVTGERDTFGTHDPAYYQQAFDLFAPAGRVALFIASYDGQDLAGVMAFALGDHAWYFYGASSNEERNRMPAYGAQWAAIQWAKAQGCLDYDLWGVPDEDEKTLEAAFTERHDGLWGVYRTKRGWGGDLIRRPSAWDHVYSSPVYRLYQAVLGRRG